MAPLTLARPVDQAARPEPHHRSHADIVLSPTPPPKAPAAAAPWQPPAAVPAAPPSPPPSAVSPVVVAAVDARARPPATKPSDLLAYISDEDK